MVLPLAAGSSGPSPVGLQLQLQLQRDELPPHHTSLAWGPRDWVVEVTPRSLLQMVHIFCEHLTKYKSRGYAKSNL